MHLKNVEKGYAQVYFEDEKCAGYVQLEEVVADVDFQKDEVVTVKRWFAYKYFNKSFNWKNGICYVRDGLRVGRFNTGYETRKDAIKALAFEYGVDISE